MIHPSTRKLIDRLNEMTLQSRIDWAEGDDGAIIYDTEGYRVTLTDNPKEIRLSDVNGKELETVGQDALLGTSTDDGQSYADLLGSMHLEAGRIARGTELAISKVLAGLDLDGDGIPDVFVEEGDEVTVAEEPAAEDPSVEETVLVESGEAAELAEEEAIEKVTEDAADPELDNDVLSMTADISRLADEVNGSEGAEDDVATIEDDAAGDGETPSYLNAGMGLAAAAAATATETMEDALEETGIADAADGFGDTVSETMSDVVETAEDAIEEVSETFGSTDAAEETAEASVGTADTEPVLEPVSEDTEPAQSMDNTISLSGLATVPLSVVPDTPVEDDAPAEIEESVVVNESASEAPVEPAPEPVSPFAPVDAFASGVPEETAPEADIGGQTVDAGESTTGDNEAAEEEGSPKPKFNPWL